MLISHCTLENGEFFKVNNMLTKSPHFIHISMVKTVMHISSTIYSDVLSTENCEEKRLLELLYLSDEILDCRIHLSIRLTFLGNLVVSMNDGGMVSAAKQLANLRQ